MLVLGCAIVQSFGQGTGIHFAEARDVAAVVSTPMPVLFQGVLPGVFPFPPVFLDHLWVGRPEKEVLPQEDDRRDAGERESVNQHSLFSETFRKDGVVSDDEYRSIADAAIPSIHVSREVVALWTPHKLTCSISPVYHDILQEL